MPFLDFKKLTYFLNIRKIDILTSKLSVESYQIEHAGLFRHYALDVPNIIREILYFKNFSHLQTLKNRHISSIFGKNCILTPKLSDYFQMNYAHSLAQWILETAFYFEKIKNFMRFLNLEKSTYAHKFLKIGIYSQLL